MIRRWVFSDPTHAVPDWTFPVNPNVMDAPALEDATEASPYGVDGLPRDVPGPQKAKDWTWQGVLYSLNHLNTFETWLHLGRTIYVTTHFGDRFAVQLKGFETERAGTRAHPERHKYTANALMLGLIGRRMP